MLYYLLFWMFMGFIIHCYIIFGTNLLTQSPVPVSVFLCFLVLQKRNTKRSPIDVPIFDDFLWTRRSPQSIGDGPEESRGHHESGGHALPPGRAPYLVATSWTPLACSRRQHLLYIPKLPEQNLDREFHHR